MKPTEKARTVRELGGEFWAELTPRLDDLGVPWEAEAGVVDLVMAVLARYDGYVLLNDVDLPVAPLPHRQG
jgi:hypothetical protein